MLFSKQIKFIDGLESNMFSQLESTIRSFDFVLKDYVINKQLFREGVDGNNVKLPGYRRTTIRLKIAKGDPVDRTTLRDDGEFYSHIQVDAFSDRFEISSNVSYDVHIIKRYGINVLKISDENLKQFIQTYFIPNFKNYVKNNFTR